MSSNRDPRTILIIDDEEAVCWALERALRRAGYAVAVAPSAEEGLQLAERLQPQVVLLDVRLPGMDGLQALPRLKQATRGAPVLVMTAFGNLTTAVKAVEEGATDYLAKPFDLDQALEAVAQALAHHASADASDLSPTTEASPPEDLVGRSQAMQAVFKRIALVAPRDACVLITGASGTGKELVARAIHRYSARRDRPFLPVHVAALNPHLVESELFGHVRGAFTGATQTRPGLLALADGGTVFLDEVADIPLGVQVKLLRVLEHGEILPVGSNQPQRLDVRVLAATHQDLAHKVAEGGFRHDLFFRLNVFQIHLPPLCDRPEDIAPLAEHFLRRVEPRALPLRAETLRFLEGQPWPGNVRQLRNALEHAAIVAMGSPLQPAHFPPATAGLAPAPDVTERLQMAVRDWLLEQIRKQEGQPPAELYEQLLSCVEPTLLDEVLKRVRGNRWEAARWLGLNRATVRKKLTHYGLAAAGEQAADEPDA